MSVSKTAIIAAIVIALAFVAGFAAGVVADRVLLIRRPLPGPHPLAVHAMAARLDHHLDLTDEQRRKIEAILERRHQEMNKVWAERRQEMHKEIEETNAEIARVLTPEQREKFEEMKMRLGPPHGEGRRRHRGRERREPTR